MNCPPSLPKDAKVSMVYIEDRVTQPPPIDELENRWSRVREVMCANNVDALIVSGQHGFSGGGGYFRWFTGTTSATSYAQVVIFPTDDLMTLVHHGELCGETVHDGSYAGHPGVGRRFTTASFPSAFYCNSLEADIIAREIRKAGYRRLGLVGAGAAYHGFIAGLHALLREFAFIDFSEEIDRIKAVKSAYDVSCIRRSAAMQDEILAKTLPHIRPGMRDFEILSYSHYVGSLLGSEGGYFLGSSAPYGQPALQRLRAFQGRSFRDGDVFIWQCENSGPEGFYTHMSRPIVFGKAPQAVVDAVEAVVEAENFLARLLRPAASCADIFAEYDAYLKERGFPEERRLACHGQGYETVERPLVRHDETMNIHANMNIGMHPYVVKKGISMVLTDNFLTHAGGEAELLHKSSRTIIEL
jgi:Xaa-Pro aminopeptidase